MLYLIVGMAGLTIGLYAGKRRQEGRKWTCIASDLATDVFGFCVLAWNKLSYPFMKGKAKKDGDSDVA